MTTVLDGGTWREGTRELLPLIDHLVVSERFARQVTGGGPAPGALDRLLDYGARAVTVTLGAGGSISRDHRGATFRQPAFAVPAVDTTGCGDVFHGGYLFGLLRGLAAAAHGALSPPPAPRSRPARWADARRSRPWPRSRRCWRRRPTAALQSRGGLI